MARAKAKYTITAEDRTAEGLRSAEGRLRGFGRNVLGALGVAVGAIGAGITAWGTAIVAAGSRLVELKGQAADLQASVEEIAAISLFAEEQEAEVSQVASAVERLRERIGEAVAGEETAVKLFRELNLEAAELAKFGPLAQLAIVGTELERIDPARRQKVQAEVLGGGTGRLFQGDFVGAAERAGAAVPVGLGRAAETTDRIGDAVERILRGMEFAIINRFGQSALAENLASGLEIAAQYPGPRLREDEGAMSLATDKLTRELQLTRQAYERGRREAGFTD